MEQSIIQTLNSQSKNMQIDVRVITLDDNLFHPYFTSIDVSKDNLSPIGIAKAITVYATDILNYWVNYTGTIVISFNMKELKHLNTNSTEYVEAHKLPQRLTNNEYNYSLICKVSKIKEKGKEIIIYFEDLGWKFLQKVPLEFRNSFIAGQPLDQAFQAICEFLGVEFAYSIEALQEYNFGADGYSIEKDGEVIETVHTILSEQEKTQEEEEEEKNPLDQENYENPSLIEYDNEHKNDENYVRNDKQNKKNINESTEKNEENKQQQEEFDKKIIDLFIGNTFYESQLTDNIMDYGRISVTPTSDTDTNNSNSNNEISEDNGNSGNNNSQNEDISDILNPNKTNIGLHNVNIVNTQQKKPTLKKHDRKSLSLNYIRTLTTSHAAELAKETGYYDAKTIKRLRRRAMGAFW